MRDEFSSLTALDLSYRNPLTKDLKQVVEDAMATGRMLTVSADRAAIDLAEHASDIQPDVIKVVDETQRIEGYVFPEWVTSQVWNVLHRKPRTLVDAVRILAETAVQRDRDHFHEWLNFATPSPVECPGGPPGSVGTHLTFGPVPCRNHR